eukprot:jgi/Picre1/34213/NNA_001687.t1
MWYSIVISALISGVFFCNQSLDSNYKKAYVASRAEWKGYKQKRIKRRRKGCSRVPGISTGCRVFGVCDTLEQLHYYDASTFVHELLQGRLDFQLQGATDAWLVDYNAALATIVSCCSSGSRMMF